MGWVNTVLTATQAAWSTFRYYMATPGAAATDSLYSDRCRQYDLGWRAYKNALWDQSNLSRWESYAQANRLYLKTDGLYNPVNRLVQFYTDHTYPGALTDDGNRREDGARLAIPLSRGISDELRSAISQTWAWAHWQNQMKLWVKYGASMGDAVIEIVDDVEAGKVYPTVIAPRLITAVDFDSRGNVIAYTKEYEVWDPSRKRNYTYKRVVDKEQIQEFTDGDLVFTDINPYGFVPLVWVRHEDEGTIPGSPAVRQFNKILRLNSLATRVHRYVERQAKTPMLLVGMGQIGAAEVGGKTVDDDDLALLSSSQEGTAIPLAGNLDLVAAGAEIERLMKEIEADHPEITAFPKLREMTTVSGRAVSLLMGDVEGRLFGVQGNYDEALISAQRQCVAIAGMRLREGKGGWTAPSVQQAKFRPFDLSSYRAGDLDHSIDLRPLAPLSPAEIAAEELAQNQAYKAGIDAGIPLEWSFKLNGQTDAQIAEFTAFKDAADTHNFLTSQRDLIPTLTQ